MPFPQLLCDFFMRIGKGNQRMPSNKIARFLEYPPKGLKKAGDSPSNKSFSDISIVNYLKELYNSKNIA